MKSLEKSASGSPKYININTHTHTHHQTTNHIRLYCPFNCIIIIDYGVSHNTSCFMWEIRFYERPHFIGRINTWNVRGSMSTGRRFDLSGVRSINFKCSTHNDKRLCVYFGSDNHTHQYRFDTSTHAYEIDDTGTTFVPMKQRGKKDIFVALDTFEWISIKSDSVIHKAGLPSPPASYPGIVGDYAFSSWVVVFVGLIIFLLVFR